jgi:uncharacterized protein YndB with AHSA1/START domain
MTNTAERSETHATFVIERRYPVAPSRVWHALSDNDARAEWFGGGADFEVDQRTHEFRVGGRGIEDGRWRNGPSSRFESTYTDILDERRIVFTYDLWVDARHLSTSLVTVVVEPDAGGALLTYTEQAVYFDALDGAAVREEGTRGILDRLGSYLSANG